VRRRSLLAGAAVLACLLSGCGGSESATAKPAASFFGVAPQDQPNKADLARMARGRVGSYHLVLPWAQIETQEGAYVWSTYDELIGELAVGGIEPIPYVFGTPTWLAPKGTLPPTRNSKGMRAYGDFLRAAAERYGPDGEFWDRFALTNPGVEPKPLRIWEIWNEVNSPNFWAPRPDPGAYAKLLRLSAKTLRKVDPEAQVMTAGMFGTPQSKKALTSFDYLKQLFRKKGVADAVDLVGVHPYAPRLRDVKRQMDKTRAIMRRGGNGDAGMWVTEIGWGSDPNVRSQLSKNPAKQAALLRKMFKMMIAQRKRWKLGGVLWYTWRDAANPTALVCGWCGSAGLVDKDLDAKPAWVEFTKLTGGDPR
jgi:polysaccharide biosynthesis protein PslG